MPVSARCSGKREYGRVMQAMRNCVGWPRGGVLPAGFSLSFCGSAGPAVAASARPASPAAPACRKARRSGPGVRGMIDSIEGLRRLADADADQLVHQEQEELGVAQVVERELVDAAGREPALLGARLLDDEHALVDAHVGDVLGAQLDGGAARWRVRWPGATRAPSLPLGVEVVGAPG